MSGRKSQRKGADGERELAALLQSYGYNIERGGSLSFGEVPDLSGLPGVHIECKRAETLRLSEWMAQAEQDAERFQDGRPAVFHRRNRSPWLVTMRLEDWTDLYAASKWAFTGDYGRSERPEGRGECIKNDRQTAKSACGPD